MKKITLFSILVICTLSVFSTSISAEFYVISVPAKCCKCEGTLTSEGRWCDNGDGTITDMTTCLVWLKKADWGGQKAWRDKSGDCTDFWSCYDDAFMKVGHLQAGVSGADLSDGSVYGEWRLPSIHELNGLTNGTEAIRYDSQAPFTGVQDANYWSASQLIGQIFLARYVNMNNGNDYSSAKETVLYVWPVRSYYK